MSDRTVPSRVWVRAPAVPADHEIVQGAIAQLTRHPLRSGLCRSVEPIPLHRRRRAAPPRRSAHHRPAPVPREEPRRRRIRAARSEQADRRRRLGDEARRETPEGPHRQPAHGRGDRGGAVGKATAEGEGEEVVRRDEAADLKATIAACLPIRQANLKELGYGG